MNWLKCVFITVVGGLFSASSISAQEPMGDMEGMPAPQPTKLELPPLPEMPDGFADVDAAEMMTSEPYSIEMLLQLAADNNPTIQQATRHISAETAKALQAGLYPNPFLMYVGEKINSDGTAGEFQGFEVSQKFVTAGKLKLSRQKYCQRARVADHLAVAQQYRVSNDVQIHFYEALAAVQRLALREELLRSGNDAAATSRELFNQGQTNLTGIRRANVDLQQRRLAVLSAENEYRDQFRRLSALVGTPLTMGVLEGELRPERALSSFNDELEKLITQSPEILAAHAKLRVDHTTVRRECVEWIPDVVIQAGPGYNFTNNDPVYNAGVQLELPIYDRNQGTIRQARQDLARQKLEIGRLQLHLREKLAMAYRHYATALQHATEYDRVVIPERKAAYRQLLSSYQENRIDWPDVLEGQREFYEARLAQIDYLKEVRIQEVMIDGFLLTGGLMAAEGPLPAGHIDSVPKPR